MTKCAFFRVARRSDIFIPKNPNMGIFKEGLGMENVGIFYCHLVDVLYGQLVYFPPFPH
jgi:hypothetical protein